MDSTNDELQRLCKRFELAVSNFGRTCFDLRAREASFQAWYASCVIQEFGLSRVYREIHLPKEDIFDGLTKDGLSDRFRLRPGQEKGALNPDLVVSWLPDLDARTAFARGEHLQSCTAMLRYIAIVSEFKVAASMKNPAQQRRAMFADLGKLLAFVRCHNKRQRSGLPNREIAAYLVVLDNYVSPENEFKSYYGQRQIGDALMEISKRWSSEVNAPVVIVITKEDGKVCVNRYREFEIDEGTE